MGELARGLPPLFEDAEVLETFARFITRRLGLAQTARRRDGLVRRLQATLSAAEWRAQDRATLMAALEVATEDSLLFRAAADVVPNQETSFFRDHEQLAEVARLIAELRGDRDASGPVRVLSAGCATGQELYSLSMMVLDQGPGFREVEYCGVDVSEAALRVAASGEFPFSVVDRAGFGPPRWQERYFSQTATGIKARPILRHGLSLHRGNLASPSWLPSLGRFDVVLCRNVLIYFTQEGISSAVSALLGRVKQGGVLALGRAEAGLASNAGFTCRAPATHALFVPGEASWNDR